MAVKPQISPRKIVLPRSTPFPNFFLDRVMPSLSHTAWKVLCFVWRKTIGWDKERDQISLSQIERGAGVCRDAALDGIRCAQSIGLIRRIARSESRGISEFEVNLDYSEKNVSHELSQLVEKSDRSKKSSFPGHSHRPSFDGKIDPQKARQKAQNQKARAGSTPFLVVDKTNKRNEAVKEDDNGSKKFDGVPVH